MTVKGVASARTPKAVEHHAREGKVVDKMKDVIVVVVTDVVAISRAVMSTTGGPRKTGSHVPVNRAAVPVRAMLPRQIRRLLRVSS